MQALERQTIEQLTSLRTTLIWMLGEVDLEISNKEIEQSKFTPPSPIYEVREKRVYRRRKKKVKVNRPTNLMKELQRYRLQNTLSTKDLGRKLGVSGSAVSAWLLGKWKPKNTEMMDKIKELVGIAKVE